MPHAAVSGKLNHLESIELAKPVIQQGRGQLLEKWLADDKLEASEELADLIMTVDINMALGIYLKANVPDKVINCYMQKGEFDAIVTYASRIKYHVDYSFMLQQLVRGNPSGMRQSSLLSHASHSLCCRCFGLRQEAGEQ